MAKQKKKKLFSNRILIITGLFTAGSIVGASVDFNSLLDLNYTIPSLQITDFVENITYDEESETERDTLQAPSVQESFVPDAPVPDPSVKEEIKETEAEPTVHEQTVHEQAIVNQPIIPEISLPEKESDPMPETESVPVLSEEWKSDDWMEAIFVPTTPTEQPGSVTTPSDDWMKKNEESISLDTIPLNVSSMTSELAGMLEGIAVFWTPAGGKMHLNPSCRSFEENIARYAGTLEEAQMIRTEGWCKLCAEHLTGTDNSEFYIKGNIYSTKEILLGCYTYSDYCNGIPAN